MASTDKGSMDISTRCSVYDASMGLDDAISKALVTIGDPASSGSALHHVTVGHVPLGTTLALTTDLTK